jgi:DNA protecting protein DprA
MNETAHTIEQLVFWLQQAPGVGAASLRLILNRLAPGDLEPNNILIFDDLRLQKEFHLKPEAIDFLRSQTPATAEAWQTLTDKGIRLLVRGFPGYPQRLNDVLRDSAPPILYVLGNQDLFNKASVGFCGSRKASPQGIGVTLECSRLLARESINVVSGYAQGVDLAAHQGALESGGTTMMVLAEGISHFRIKEKLMTGLDDDALSRTLIVSEFPPGLPWKAHNAMTRNRTICGLSDVLVIIESGLEGGTFEAGNTALSLNVPLFCVQYADPAPSAAGNPYFLQHGATALKRSQDGRPNLGALLSTVEKTSISNLRPERQGELVF